MSTQPPTKKKLARREIVSIAGKIFNRKPLSVVPLGSNRPDRHWNWKVSFRARRLLLRVENPLAVRQRGTRLRDEAKIVEFFGNYGLAPRLLAQGNFRGLHFMAEEWINGKFLPKAGSIQVRDLKSVVAFLVAINHVPVTRTTRELLAWKEDFLDVGKRRRVVAKRLRAGFKVPEFRALIKSIRPVLEKGFAKLESLLKKFPRRLLYAPRFVYRDIGPRNLLTMGSRCIAVDWEWHSVGLADPSFSLVVFMRRFRLGPKLRQAVLNEYTKHERVSHLEELIRARELERVLGEATWPFSWTARFMKLPLPDKESQKKAAIRTVLKSTAELERMLAD